MEGDVTMEKCKMIINYISDNETIKFAAEELAKYIKQMSVDSIRVEIIKNNVAINKGKQSVKIGLFDELGISSEGVEDPKFDDEVHIDIINGCGIIAGINPRSVLSGVYRFLIEAGCMWVRPGSDGEFIPRKDIYEISVKLHERASYRHRGICIEGAVSYENIYDIIEWAPKVGFNAYYVQQRIPYVFFERWYYHKNNPYKGPEEFSVETAKKFLTDFEKEIKKRDLLYHAVGHGWNCEPFGMVECYGDNVGYEVKPEVVQYLAEINGKRDVTGGTPYNTSICYSNAEARQIIINDVANYLKKHPQVDYLHFWLADGYNNQCECENCRKMIPSDYYVILLNELDELLTKKGIDTKIVFLIYNDLLWAPEKQVIKNPSRFVLMFAPISRSFSTPFEPVEELPKLPKYERNKLTFSSDLKVNLAFLKEWERVFKGDSFDFDYHFMWDHYVDPGYYKIARILSQDIKNLRSIGLNGFMSCQVQRSFFPTGLGMYVLGRTLWNRNTDFEELSKKYFECAFGKDSEKCREYLAGLSELFDPDYLRGKRPIVDKDTAERFSSICAYINEFRHVIETNLKADNPCHAASWNYLRYHADLCSILAVTLEAKACADRKKARALWNLARNYAFEHEELVQKVFDVYEFDLVWGGSI